MIFNYFPTYKFMLYSHVKPGDVHLHISEKAIYIMTSFDVNYNYQNLSPFLFLILLRVIVIKLHCDLNRKEKMNPGSCSQMMTTYKAAI